MPNLLRFSKMTPCHEGFWVDHWHYIVDALEMLRAVHPDRALEIMLAPRRSSYFDDPDVIVPRTEKYVEVAGKIRQYGAVVRDPEKRARIAGRSEDANRARTRHGKGAVYRTSLFAQLLTIVVNRLATLDAAGTGIEKEAGKPGWNDSMNGLPALFGSGLSETLELLRATRMLRELVGEMPEERTVAVHEELALFTRAIRPLVRERSKKRTPAAAHAYWERATALKEAYRAAVRLGVSGSEVQIAREDLAQLLDEAAGMLDAIFKGRDRARVMNRRKIPFTYFVNDIVERTRGSSFSVKRFAQRPVRLFLEGPVHWMKVRRRDARGVYDAVRASPLYDRKLGMYRACENMDRESPELGRAVGAYPRGWIENESIYLHMEYKYLLEILRSGLAEEFWRDAKTALVPFMDPAVYGRSTLEGASFIVSSAYADPRHHGRAFQPRLSGITCEMLHIWDPRRVGRGAVHHEARLAAARARASTPRVALHEEAFAAAHA